MNKQSKILVISVIGLIVVAGGAIALSSRDTTTSQSQNAVEQSTESTDAVATTDNQELSVASESEDNQASSMKGSFITLADYEANPGQYQDSKKVHFFHASWCPVCNGIEKEINADMSKIPQGVTIIKTDFDKETDLKKKFGVTTQATFVQIDESGNEIAQWSADSLDKAVKGIKS